MDYRTFRLAAVHEIVGSGGAFQPVVWGDLSGLPLPDLLNVLSHGKRTGLLLVRGKDTSERALGLVDGHITWAGSSVTTEMDVREVCFGLVRLHHGHRGRGGNYSESELHEWAQRVRRWRRRAEVLVYFNNDWEAYAVRNALRLRRLLEG